MPSPIRRPTAGESGGRMSKFSEDVARTRGKPLTYCKGKVQFESFAMAEGVARRTNRARDMQAAVYRCGECLRFHIGVRGNVMKRHQRHDFKQRRVAAREAMR